MDIITEKVNFDDYETVVIDLETTGKNKGEDAVGSFSASPHHPENSIFLSGLKDARGYSIEATWTDSAKFLAPITKPILFVGHNIKFDLMYLWYHDKHWMDKLKYPKIHIWDTMIAEYILSGHTSKFASLDKLSAKYGGTKKDESIKAAFEDGIDIETVPIEKLKHYLIMDLYNTDVCFLKQFFKATKEQKQHIIRQSDLSLVLAEIECNGMHFNIEIANKEYNAVSIAYNNAKKNVLDGMYNAGIFNANPNSTHHMSLYVFGGNQACTADEPLLTEDGEYVRFKSGLRKGQIRTKKTVYNKLIGAMCAVIKEEWKTKTEGIYSTSDAVLNEILSMGCVHHTAESRIKEILIYRGLAKDINTYWKGFVSHYWPHDTLIHGTFHQTSTRTGRLSSSSPNMQNLSGISYED